MSETTVADTKKGGGAVSETVEIVKTIVYALLIVTSYLGTVKPF